tara:strand:- start:113 stop:529 length:417 start_codon:yes stop_codon:yes gene_type:complete
MIKYNLICKCEKVFESWFSSSDNYELLLKKKLINCIYCDSTKVKKSVMSPNLSSKTNKISKNEKFQKKVKKQLLQLRKHIEKNCKYVGDSFSYEARNIHYDKKTSQGIYGKATEDETAELADEGIDVMTVPWIDKSEN